MATKVVWIDGKPVEVDKEATWIDGKPGQYGEVTAYTLSLGAGAYTLTGKDVTLTYTPSIRRRPGRLLRLGVG